MNRYIRTKDNVVFDLEKIKAELISNTKNPELYEFGDWRLWATDNELILGWTKKRKESKSGKEYYSVSLNCQSVEYSGSDNIEDLFDWLVFKYEGTIMAMYKSYDIAVQCEGNHVLAFDEVIGAIETPKGLIFIAKEKKEGGWEML